MKGPLSTLRISPFPKRSSRAVSLTPTYTTVTTRVPEQSMATALSTQRRLLGQWTKQLPSSHDYFSTNSPQKKKQQELVIPVELVSDTL